VHTAAGIAILRGSGLGLTPSTAATLWKKALSMTTISIRRRVYVRVGLPHDCPFVRSPRVGAAQLPHIGRSSRSALMHFISVYVSS
jgi:hypothetical protein